MREIKFRIRYKGTCGSPITAMLVPLFNKDNGLLQHPFDTKAWDILSIDEYIGLKDKNGKEIYEGDIYYLAGHGNCIAEFPFIDFYEAALENDIGDHLGNIHENPELL